MDSKEWNELVDKHYDLLLDVKARNDLIKEVFMIHADGTVAFTGKLSEESIELIRGVLE